MHGMIDLETLGVKPNSAIPAFVREMARLALGAYKKTANVNGWKRDKELSNGKTSIYLSLSLFLHGVVN